MKKGVIVLVMFLVVGACKPHEQQPPANITNETFTLDLSKSAERGDLLTVNYVMTLDNGSVVDTNNGKIAQQNSVKNYVDGPFAFILGESGKLAGFDKAIEKMAVGKHKEYIIEPTEKEVILTLNKTQGMKRSLELPLKRAFKLKSFQDVFGKPPIIGQIVFNERFPFRYQVLNISNTSVAVQAIVKEGDTYQLEGWPWSSKLLSILKKEDVGIFLHVPTPNQTFASEFGPAQVMSSNGTLIIIHHEPELNQLINKTIPVNGVPISQQFQVIAKTDDTFTIQRYGLLTDKRVHLSVDLLNLTKDVKVVKDPIHTRTSTSSPAEAN